MIHPLTCRPLHLLISFPHFSSLPVLHLFFCSFIIGSDCLPFQVLICFCYICFCSDIFLNVVNGMSLLPLSTFNFSSNIKLRLDVKLDVVLVVMKKLKVNVLEAASVLPETSNLLCMFYFCPQILVWPYPRWMSDWNRVEIFLSVVKILSYMSYNSDFLNNFAYKHYYLSH